MSLSRFLILISSLQSRSQKILLHGMSLSQFLILISPAQSWRQKILLHRKSLNRFLRFLIRIYPPKLQSQNKILLHGMNLNRFLILIYPLRSRSQKILLHGVKFRNSYYQPNMIRMYFPHLWVNQSLLHGMKYWKLLYLIFLITAQMMRFCYYMLVMILISVKLIRLQSQ